MTVYLDCNATTPMDPRVQAEVLRCFSEEYGNAGSPHEFGQRAKQLVHAARDRIAEVVGARRNEIIFTSGATESNNLAILGLADEGLRTGKRHVVSTQIEHKAVLEPLAELRNRGFEVTRIAPDANGRVPASSVINAIRTDTLLVSVMHVNNETGIIQPIGEIADGLRGRDVFLHVDAAQGFGKDIDPLRNPRIDLISVSSHKIFGPVGVGALVVRRRHPFVVPPSGAFVVPPSGGNDVRLKAELRTIPLTPLMYGGGQELGLRPGTLPVALISGFGLAAELALRDAEPRHAACRRMQRQILVGLAELRPVLHGDPELALPHVLCLSLANRDAEQVIELLEGVAAVSTGSACTSICATSSHVLAAMGVHQPESDGAVRLSWSHLTNERELAKALPEFIARLAPVPVG